MIYYGITPPKSTVSEEELSNIIAVTQQRLRAMKAKKLIVYDIQDESARINTPRPFPFFETLDPLSYCELLTKTFPIDITLYNCVVAKSLEAFTAWCERAASLPSIKQVVLVGGQKSGLTYQGPKLSEAIASAKEHCYPFQLGGVVIPERHISKGDEPTRLQAKQKAGCEFFVSQCVYDVNCLTRFIDDARQRFGEQLPHLTITLTPCGNAKTFDFLRWLGVSVDQHLESRILNAEDPVQESCRVCLQIAKTLTHRYPDIRLHFNIESVSKRKVEIDAACQLFAQLEAHTQFVYGDL